MLVALKFWEGLPMKYLLCLKYFWILILKPRWIYRFFCSFMILCFGTSFKRLEIAHLIAHRPSKVTLCDVFLIMWLTFDNIIHLTIYTQEERKLHFSYHMWYFMCYVGLTCTQDHCLFGWTPCVVSLSFFFSDTLCSGNINSWRSFMEIFSCLLDTFPVRASYFLLI